MPILIKHVCVNYLKKQTRNCRFLHGFFFSGCCQCFLAYFGGPVVWLVSDPSYGPNTFVYTIYPTTKNIDIQRVWTETTFFGRFVFDVILKKNHRTFSPDLNSNRSVTRPPPVATPSFYRPSLTSRSLACEVEIMYCFRKYFTNRFRTPTHWGRRVRRVDTFVTCTRCCDGDGGVRRPKTSAAVHVIAGWLPAASRDVA